MVKQCMYCAGKHLDEGITAIQKSLSPEVVPPIQCTINHLLDSITFMQEAGSAGFQFPISQQDLWDVIEELQPLLEEERAQGLVPFEDPESVFIPPITEGELWTEIKGFDKELLLAQVPASS